MSVYSALSGRGVDRSQAEEMTAPERKRSDSVDGHSTTKDQARAMAALERHAAELEQENRAFREMLLEASHLQRKLAGPRRLMLGEYEVANETFAASSLSGDLCTSF